jgi:hypothetical protein
MLEKACQNHLFRLRWPEGFRCPRCAHPEAYFHRTRHLYHCKACGYQASLTAGTIFHKTTRTPLTSGARRVYIIIERHPVHRSRKVKNWVKENEERIRLVFLPSYSPELNPDELLNQDVKSNALGRQRPGDQTELMGKVRSYLRSRQCKPDIVANYFLGKHVQYAAYAA